MNINKKESSDQTSDPNVKIQVNRHFSSSLTRRSKTRRTPDRKPDQKPDQKPEGFKYRDQSGEETDNGNNPRTSRSLVKNLGSNRSGLPPVPHKS
jgi:hypothetical protein